MTHLIGQRRATSRRHGRPAGPGSGQSGYTLLELMLVITIIGIIAAIIVPNLERMWHRANKMRVLTDIDAVMKSWRSEFGPICKFIQWGTSVDLESEFPQVLNATELSVLLKSSMPVVDPWGRPYEYRFNTVSGNKASCLMMRSGNQDKTLEAGPMTMGTRFSLDENELDIVHSSSGWVQRCDSTVPSGVIITPEVVGAPPFPIDAGQIDPGEDLPGVIITLPE